MTYDSEDLTEKQLERIIEMALEGRTHFLNFLTSIGFSENLVIIKMRDNLNLKRV